MKLLEKIKSIGEERVSVNLLLLFSLVIFGFGLLIGWNEGWGDGLKFMKMTNCDEEDARDVYRLLHPGEY